jgi:hypothetical protein
MRLRKRPALRALVLTAALGAGASRLVQAQEPVPREFDCGPMYIFAGDLVALNVGNAGRAPQGPVVVLLRLLDSAGAALVERTLTLAPGQSSFTYRLPAQAGLVRGEVVPVSPPDDLRLTATMQVLVRAGQLTVGPIVECAGPTGNRGPV